MSMNPNKLSFMRQTEFIPVMDFLGLSGPPTITVDKAAIGLNLELGVSSDTDGVAVCNNTIANDLLGVTGVQPPASCGAGLPVMKEITTLGLSGLLMEEAGDDVRHFMRIPSHWDRNHPIYVRAIWSSLAAAVGDRDITWKFLYALLTANTTALAAPATALDTALVADPPVGTSKTLQATADGIINAGTIADANTHISFLMEMDAFDAAFTEDKYLLGVEFDYTPRFGRGQVRREARSWQAY